LRQKGIDMALKSIGQDERRIEGTPVFGAMKKRRKQNPDRHASSPVVCGPLSTSSMAFRSKQTLMRVNQLGEGNLALLDAELSY
jgi:hypothetical protein